MTTRTRREIKGDRPLHGVAPDTPVRGVAELMAENGIGAVVVPEGQALSGILSEREIVFRCGGKGRTVENTRATQIMTADPATAPIVALDLTK